LQTWLTPITGIDHSDPKLAHLDGLNLSRAWCWQMIFAGMPDRLHRPVRQAIDAHRDAALPHVIAGDYAGTHWLASFAMLALDGPVV
jgi:hypothetical protein